MYSMGMGKDLVDMCNHFHLNEHVNESLDQRTFSSNVLNITRKDECALVVVTVKLLTQTMDDEIEKGGKDSENFQADEQHLHSQEDAFKDSTGNITSGAKTPEVVITNSFGDMPFVQININSDVNHHMSDDHYGGVFSRHNELYQDRGNIHERTSDGYENDRRRSKKRYNGHNHFNNATADDPDISGDQSISPRRSPSPYSCGNLSGFREPGNISSQNFQENWDTPARASHEKENALENSLRAQNATTSLNGVSVHHPNDHRNNSYFEEAQRLEQNASEHNDKMCTSIPVVEYTEESPVAVSDPINDGHRCVKLSEVKKVNDNNIPGDSKQVQPFKNDCLIRISHCLQEGHVERRVEDVRTVAELMDMYSSLKDPVILPYARQRTFYDQWARFPRGDVSNRLYPRSSSNLSIKCWTLFQAIQNDQKSNSGQTGPGTKQLVPNPADVTCKSLASIIEHYNQLSVLQSPIFFSPIKTPPTTPLKHVATKTSSGQSSSSRSSSGNSNERGQLNFSNQGQGEGRMDQSDEKHSPVPLRKKSSLCFSKGCQNQENGGTQNNGNDVDEYSWNNELDRLRENSINEHQTTFVDTLPERLHHTNNLLDIRQQQKDCSLQTSFSDTVITPAKMLSSEQDVKDVDMLQRDLIHRGHQRKCHNNQIPFHPDNSPFPSNDKRKITKSVKITVRDADDNCVEHDTPGFSLEKRNETLTTKDYFRNAYDVNTNTLSLNLPHEFASHGNDFYETSFPLSPGEKRIFSYQNPGSANTFGRTRRSKTRLYFSQMSPKNERRESSFYSSSAPHSQQHLKQTLQIQELHCPKDMDYKYTREKTAKKTGRSRSSTWKSNNKAPELPTRGYSMCERIEPSENPFGRLALSTEVGRPRSARQSAVSLANVHFLDLSDLKTMLRKNNTPIPRL